MAEGGSHALQFTPDGVNAAVNQAGAPDVQPTISEDGSHDLQFTPDGVNAAVYQEGAPGVQPTISVSTNRDARSQEPVEISEITGQFENVQAGESSNVLYKTDEGEDVSIHGTRPPTSVTTNDNLHFIIDSPQGVIQIGKCCIVVRVNFSNSLVSRLLDQGDVSVKLQSSDTLLELNWSNWEEKKEGIRSKIKVEIQTSLEESRDSFEQDAIRLLLDNSNDYLQLCTLVKRLYNMFGAMIHKITGGCIELWIIHDSKEQLDDMKRRKLEVENELTDLLCFHCFRGGHDEHRVCIEFQEDASHQPESPDEPIQGLEMGHDTSTLESPAPSADAVFIIKGREKIKRKSVEIKRKSGELVSREEMQTYVKETVKQAIEESRETKWQTEPAPQTYIEQKGGMMIDEEVKIREIMMHQETKERLPQKLCCVKKEQLQGIIWLRLDDIAGTEKKIMLKRKGKRISLQLDNLVASYHESILDNVDRFLPDELYIDIPKFEKSIYDIVNRFYQRMYLQLTLSAFDKDHLSETEINELKVRNKTAVEMCGRGIAAYAMQFVTPPQHRQTTERLIKETEDTDMHVPERKEDTVRPVDAETIRLRKERLLQQATTSQKDFQKVELDFYEINEKPDSELPLGTRVEPKSKRALLQASLQRPGAEATARLEAAEETFGTVVSHSVEDEEQVIVHWDNPNESFLYHESGIRAIMRQVPRKIMREQQVGIGVFVEKSANWAFEDQAGPVGVGTVIRHDIETGLVQVKWHGGVPGWNSYRTAEDVETRQECFIDGEEQSSDD